MNNNQDNTTNSTSNNQPTVTIPTQTLIQIYNLLYSIEVKGDSVKTIAVIEQIIEQLLNQSPNEVK